MTMKIISLTAENVKRLKAVEIEPDGTIQVITGRNAQGKSSVLDAIWLALGGGQAAKATTRPIRDGEDHARVTLDLGDFLVTRSWKGDKTTLTVKGADGHSFKSPQAVLDGLVGRLSFDPLEFTRRSPRDQRDALIDLVELDFDPAELEIERAKVYEERLEIGRERKAFGDIATYNTTMPAKETSVKELAAEINEARAAERVESNGRDLIAERRRVYDNLETRINELTLSLAAAEKAKTTAEAAWQEAEEALVPAPEGVADALEQKLMVVDIANKSIRTNNERRLQAKKHRALTRRYDGATKALDELDEVKRAGLAAAKFPVPGLGFDDDGVTYQGIPFGQTSSSEQIRVSLAMAMASNPKLRVIRIMDGSLLDYDSMALVTEAAVEGDYQVWIERVGTGDGDSEVVIEDGQIVGAP